MVAIGLLLLPAYSPAQQTDLSQQVQLFNSMTPEQQQAILQRLGGGSGGLGGGLGGGGLGGLGGLGGGGLGGLGSGSSLLGGGFGNRSQAALLQQMQLQQQRRLAGQLQDQTEFPVFKPGDTVLVEVSLLAEKPAGSGDQNNQNNQNNQNAPAQNTAPAVPNVTSINPQRLSDAQLSLLGLNNGMNGQRVQEQPQRTIEQLQADLDAWLREYNELRPHQGRWCYGKTPMQTFVDSVPLAKEKMLGPTIASAAAAESLGL